MTDTSLNPGDDERREFALVDMPCRSCEPDPSDPDCPTCTGSGRMPVPDEVRQVFDEFWRPLVVVDGRLDPGQVAAELHDYHQVIEAVPTIFMAVTGGRLSYPHYPASSVLAAYEDHLSRLHDEWVDDAMKLLDDLPADLRDRVRTAMEEA